MTESIIIPSSVATIIDYETIANIFNIVEFINGDIIVKPPPTIKHQILVSKLVTSLNNFPHNRLMMILSSPVGVKFENNILEPDVLVMKNMDNQSIEGNYIVIPPILIIEILSPSMRHRD